MLGGVDPYSASKGAAELIIRSYRESFFKNKKNAEYLVLEPAMLLVEVIGLKKD